MTIDKAIQNLEAQLSGLHPEFDIEDIDGLRLGIEALKRVGAYRHFPDRGPGELLPGETKE